MDHRCYLYLITMGRYDQNGSTMVLSKWIYDLLLSWKLTGPEVSEETCLIPGGPIAMRSLLAAKLQETYVRSLLGDLFASCMRGRLLRRPAALTLLD